MHGKHHSKKGTVTELKLRDSGIVVKVLCDNEKEPVRVWKEDIQLIDQESPLISTHPITKRLPPWLRPNLKVKIINKTILNGQDYKRKAIIQDMTSPYSCILRTEDGRILEGKTPLLFPLLIPFDSDFLFNPAHFSVHIHSIDIQQEDLETVIPSTADHVMIVLHPNTHLIGQTAKILEKSKDKDEAIVRFDATFDIEVNISFIGLVRSLTKIQTFTLHSDTSL